MLPCAPAIRVTPDFVTRMLPILPQLMSALRGVSSLGRHVGTVKRRLSSGVVFLHSDAVVHAVLIATFTSAGARGTDGSCIMSGQQSHVEPQGQQHLTISWMHSSGGCFMQRHVELPHLHSQQQTLSTASRVEQA